MSAYDDLTRPSRAEAQSAWGAVVALALGAAACVTSELMPASVIVPMAEGLGITEGLAGQAMSIPAFAAIFASLFGATVVRRVDRKRVVLCCGLLVALAAFVVATAANVWVMLAGRALFGLAAGTFWAITASLVLRLVRERDVAKALSVIFGAVPMAILVSVPAGNLLSEILGWRGVFAIAGGLACLSVAVQWLTLPALPSDHKTGSIAGVWALRHHPKLVWALGALALIFAGKFALFTYVRPYFEQIGGLSVAQISSILIGYGLANLIGTALSSIAITRNLRATLAVAPALLCLCAVALLTLPMTLGTVGVVMALWGFAIGFIPVAWTAWMARELGHDAENAGSLQFSTMQAAIASGVLGGGMAFDLSGPRATFLLGAALLVIAVVVVLRHVPVKPAPDPR